jgi:hypothetical protein
LKNWYMDYADWLCTGLVALLTAKPSEIKLLLRDQLEPTRAEELLRQMQAAGLPVPDRIGGAEASKGA